MMHSMRTRRNVQDWCCAQPTFTVARYMHSAMAKAKFPATAMAIFEVDRYCSAGKNLRCHANR